MCARPASFLFSGKSGGRTARCDRHAVFYPQVRDRALRVALVVGTLLFVINQLDVVLRGDVTAIVLAKIALTFLVPYAVSTYSALQVRRLG